MTETLRGVDAAIAGGWVPDERRAALTEVARRFSVAVTPAMLDLIDPTDPHDPIARQFIPAVEELVVAPEERRDPIADEAHSPLPGLVHRYPDRVLLKLATVCPVYCRFCFRRELIGPAADGLTPDQVAAALDYVAARPEIWEIILSGGDPMILSPRRLAEVRTRVDGIAHVGVLRLHTRVPVVDPGRVDGALVAALKGRAATWVLLHANHAREFAPDAVAAIGRLVDAGIPVLGQSVLLAGVNDSVEALTALFRAMVAARVKPHYLHHPDQALGTGHFRLPIQSGQALVGALRGAVSGLCQPTYMLDIPGGHGKVPIGPEHLGPGDQPGRWSVRDVRGVWRAYRED